MIVPDAYGGRGGIARLSCDIAEAVASHDGWKVAVVLRRPPLERFELPANIECVWPRAEGKLAFAFFALVYAMRRRFDLVVCGHINLLPIAGIAATLRRAPLVLVANGIEVWRRPSNQLVTRWVKGTARIIAISEFTKRKLLQWAPIVDRQVVVIPCAVDLERFRPGAKPPNLVSRYRLEESKVLLTVARLSAAERYKGVDELLEVMPSLLREVPSLRYLIVGDGDDRSRLATKAASLGLGDRVIFAGHVPEAEKADYYRLADAFAMPGRGEGFGIVYLEALACGVPVVASRADASSEIIVDEALGIVADPNDSADIVNAVLSTLSRRNGFARQLIEHFGRHKFAHRVQEFLDEIAPLRKASE
jgi:glycosyltransferase involved in cell wall biosynthesis